MPYRNKYNLPLPIYLALVADDYDKQGDYSVTELNGPVRAALICQRHKDEIVIEASSNLWMMRGNSMHYMADKVNIPGAIQEQRVMFEFHDKQISMKADIIYPINKKPEYEGIDYKDTKVFIAQNNIIKDEWKWQQNSYRLGYQAQFGINIVSMKNILMLGDWKYTERYIKYAKQTKHCEHRYPDIPIHVVEIPIFEESKTLDYLRDRINLFEDNKHTPDDELPLCSEEERWADKDVFAVVTKNGHAVTRGGKFNSKPEAEVFQEARWSKAEVYKADGVTLKKSAIKRGDTHIEYRRGESKRCERGYCNAAPFCNQYKQIRKDPF